MTNVRFELFTDVPDEADLIAYLESLPKARRDQAVLRCVLRGYQAEIASQHTQPPTPIPATTPGVVENPPSHTADDQQTGDISLSALRHVIGKR